MRTALRVLPAILTAALAGAASAHLGDTIFPIWELPTSDLPDLHDGTLEDWEEVLPNASLGHNDFVRYGFDSTTIDPEDLAFRAFLAWHNASQRLFVAVERIDNAYIGLGQGDGTMFFVDGDHSGGEYETVTSSGEREADKAFTHVQAQWYFVSPEPLEGRLMREGGPADAWVANPPWADAGGFQIGEAPNYSVNELVITPWDVLDWRGADRSQRSSLIAGQIIGLQFAILDIDEPSWMQGLYYLTPRTIEPGQPWTADTFADGELIPCFRGDCSGAITAVSQDSWGRIKASFR